MTKPIPRTPVPTNAKEGSLRIVVSEENLPRCLLEAKVAVEQGHVAKAKEVLNDQAIEVVSKMLAEHPSRTDVMFLFALMLYKVGHWTRAEQWYKKILEVEQNALAYHELGRICRQTGRITEARQYREKAVRTDPDNTGILTTFALDLIRAGQTRKGLETLREVLEKDPHNVDAHSKLLFHLHYLPDLDGQMLLAEHKQWGFTHAPVNLARRSHANDPDPDRRLRVGYISSDFRSHSVAYNFEAFLSGRDCDALEVYGYGNVAKPDSMTERLQEQFDHYRNVRGQSDEAVVRVVEQDKIDIMVEIGGHTADNRLLVMAHRPAPVQVDYGGINTSGMEQIDYRLTDELLDPPDLRQFYVEESVCLPGGLFCYSPPDFAPPVVPPPAARNGYITFGSFSNSLKIHRYIISLWAQVLKANDGSRLLLKFTGGHDHDRRNNIIHQFEEMGIEQDRIEIHGWKSRVEHLQLYSDMDIALDTYPYNGCLTTLEALWMGIPVISLYGNHISLSRAGLSILNRLDMDFFAASTPEEYVSKSTMLASNVEALAKIRASMRTRMAASTLCDAKRFAREVEDAYRQMWRRWCQTQRVDAPDKQPDLLGRQSNDNSTVCSHVGVNSSQKV
ncbi:MAG: O-linked N-acetylglucosamine transferase, SPINDLY family protein [Planctomycetota bacterium]|jgi:predicted O-linked N-acetylglucosamine transferase (SPINDLY family)